MPDPAPPPDPLSLQGLALRFAAGGSPPAFAERALRVVPRQLAVARRAPGALRRRRDWPLAPRKCTDLGHHLGHERSSRAESPSYHNISFSFIT